ncbi:MAG: YqgE/AlgH family protein [Burkholderiales bacterium]
MQNVRLVNHFLIAMPAMADPNFSRTVTFICEHNDDGALGIVVNRPTSMTLQALCEQMNIRLQDAGVGRSAVHFGGPVQLDRGFVLHCPVGSWQSTLAVDDSIGLTTSKDVLEAAARGEGPQKILVTLGYAGWAAGQLENELKQNAWLTVHATSQIIFDLPPAERLEAAMKSLGIDYASLVDNAGHA